MFEINDYIMYGTTGVCKVLDIKKESIGGNVQKEYYVLSPIYSNNTIIKIPVDNEKIAMRNIISKENVTSLIENMPNKELLWIKDDRQRGELFKSMLKTGECEELITLIKSIYQYKKNKKEMGIKISKNDEEIMQIAEKLLNEEFATILNINPEEVTSYILNNIQE
ncbi:MAG: CarD family transcriptional regulator [Peptostreptococcaceae bacterium]